MNRCTNTIEQLCLSLASVILLHIYYNILQNTKIFFKPCKSTKETDISTTEHHIFTSQKDTVIVI